MKNTSKAESEKVRSLRREFTGQFYAHNRFFFISCIAVTVIMAAVNLVISYLMQVIIDASTGSDMAPLIKILIVSAVCFAGFIIFAAADCFVSPAFKCVAMRQYKDYAFSRITQKSISSFNGESTGLYISALTNDAATIQAGLVGNIFTLIMQMIMFVGALGMMLFYSPLLTLAAILLSALPTVVSVLTGSRLAAWTRRVSDENEKFVGLIKDLLTGFTVIKSFKAEKEVEKLYRGQNSKVEETKRRSGLITLVIQSLGAATSIVAQFGVFLIGAYLAISGRGVTPGVVIVFVQLMNFVLQPISSVPPILAERKAARGLIDKLAAAVSSNVRRDGKDVDKTLDEGISVKDVAFSYEPEGEPVLRGFSAEFKAGRSYALVGGSGSGKSTFLNLLMGSRDDYKGEISFDGEELRAISSDSLYELVSIVQQNVFVFNSSIRDNITLFRSFDEDKILSAVERSGLKELFNDRGGDYLCGENGAALSGGERQRVSIARCLLRETPVLLVDEATAALDSATAYAVTSSILDIHDLTRIVVTHRLEAALLRRYDEIMVIRGGRVYEQGTFDALMAQKGYFYSLYNVASADAEEARAQ